MARTPRSLVGRVLHRHYRVVRHIGRGAMGDVYLAEHLGQDGLKVALKVLRPELAAQIDLGRRFRAEGAVLARLDHPHILRMYDRFDDDGTVCMALAFVDGESLDERLRRRRPLEPAEALPIFKNILDALDCAHRAGVVHRDVKPSNVLLDRDDRPYLCDFGIARQFGQRGVTAVGVTLGTPQYMSPEQIVSPQRIDHRSDLYSAGIVLYEMLTGEVPFGNDDAQSDRETLAQQVRSAPRDPRLINPRLDEGLADVLDKALRKEPDRRFQGGQEFREAIERIERRLAPSRAPAPGAQRAGPTTAARRYTVYEHPLLGRTAARVGPCWPALFFGPLWMLSKTLRLHALLWFVGEAVLAAAIAMLVNASSDGMLVAALTVIAAVIWTMPVVFGNRWRADDLARRGYASVADVDAASEQAAIEQVSAAARR